MNDGPTSDSPLWEGEVVEFETFDSDVCEVNITVRSKTPIPPVSLGWCHIVAYPARGPATDGAG